MQLCENLKFICVFPIVRLSDGTDLGYGDNKFPVLAQH